MKLVQLILFAFLLVSFTEQNIFKKIGDAIKGIFKKPEEKPAPEQKRQNIRICDGFVVPNQFTRCVEALQFAGIEGSWGDVQYVNNNQRGAAAQFRFQPHQGKGDDTGGNGIRIGFRNGNGKYTYKEASGNWGNWQPAQPQECPSGWYISGFRVRFEKQQGRNGDNTALNGLQIKCKNPDSYQTQQITVYGGKWGDWEKWIESEHHYLCGFKTRFHDCKNEKCDDSGLNGIRFFMCGKP